MTIRNRYGRSIAEEAARLKKQSERLGRIKRNTNKLNTLGDVADWDVPRDSDGNNVTLYIKHDANDAYALQRINKRLGTTLTVGASETIKMRHATVTITVRKGKPSRQRRAA